jgi:hypothetical protein
MGEAKRRRASGDYPTISLAVPVDLKDDIAIAIGAVSLTQMGGSCIPYVQVASEVLKRLGFCPRIEYGAALYRVGANERRDTIAYCAQNNMGCMVPDYGFVGHAWLRLGADLLDFTAWARMAEAGYLALGATADDPFAAPEARAIANAERDLGPPEFASPPPAYLWRRAAPLMASWRSSGSPEIGEFWFGPFDRRNGVPPVDVQQAAVEFMLPATMAAVRTLHLVERVTEWRGSQRDG